MDNIDTEELINDLINSDTENINTSSNIDNETDINSTNIQHSSSFNSNESEEKSSDDLTTSLLSVNDEELLNNYKYSQNVEENINITVEHFMKILNEYPEIFNMMNNVKTDIKNLPELMIFLKEKDHKLSLNLMDYPQNCFDKIFSLIKNNNINLEDYENEIKAIQEILPYINKEQIIEALEVCNKNIELSINYLYDTI